MTRPVTVTTPIEGLRLRTLRITERFGELFDADLSLEGDGSVSCLEVGLEDLVGNEVSVAVDREDGTQRYFHAIVASAVHEDHDRIRARLVPWTWLLTLATDVRIFQDMTVPEIVAKVIDEHGFSASFRQALSGTYAKRVYCTQYRESAYNFIARLLEEEGIYFYFEHEESKHTLVLADSLNAHSPAQGCESLVFRPPSQARTATPHVRQFGGTKAVVPAKYTVRDYFFAKATQKFEAKVDSPQQHGESKLEVYDYPGNYAFLGEAAGKSLARRRLEELQVPYATFRGTAESHGVTCGCLLTLEDHPRDDYNREYLITGTICNVNAGSYASGGGGDATMDVSFEAIASDRPFRPARRTPRPRVYGLHTAVVVGKDMQANNEDIYTDADGRVLVQFHWDRLGQRDEKSSTWLRVSSPWAGTQRGWLSLPRVGDEVIVDFLEGDPDWPIVTGSVYNSANKWPFPLPDQKNLSGFYSRSTPGGDPPRHPPPSPPLSADSPAGDFNRLIFDDTKGEEAVEIVARKNMLRNIWNNDHTWIGKARRMKVDDVEELEVKKDRSRKVGENEKVEIGKDQSLKIGKKLLIDVADEIEIKTGMSKLVMKKDGTITLDGKDLKVATSLSMDFSTTKFKAEAKATAEMKANATFKVESSAMLELKGGAMTKVSGGAMLDLKGGGMTMVKGGIVMIN